MSDLAFREGGFGDDAVDYLAAWDTQREIHARVTASMHGGSSLYELDEAALEAAKPDLIITQELCRVCAVSYREVNDAVKALELDTTVISLEPLDLAAVAQAGTWGPASSTASISGNFAVPPGSRARDTTLPTTKRSGLSASWSTANPSIRSMPSAHN